MWFWNSWAASTRAMRVTAIAVTVAAVLFSTADADPVQDTAKKVDTKSGSADKGETPAPPPEKLGVLVNDALAFPGYNLINPAGKKTYLFDNAGHVVHTWTSEYTSGAAAYLLENGHLFRPAEVVNRQSKFKGPAVGGRIQEFDWDGNLVWDFEYHSDKRLPHHDAIKLPNGNALLICWEMIEEKEAIAQGRRPETVKDSHLQPDCLVEIKPTGKKSGEVVWEWRSWDHLIQDRDKTKPNYGEVSKHPERFDVNYIRGEADQAAKPPATKDGSAQKTAVGKGQPKDAPKKGSPPRKDPDWMHVNAVAYNADLDQIVLSSPHFCEIWIIDHGTTTEEARGHTGGRWGKGGDILYRWGNPVAYRHGTKRDQRLFFQHNIQWIPKGLSGEGHLLVFNNGAGRTPDEYSSVDEFVPPTDPDGNYTRDPLGTFGPAQALWSYSAPNKKDFFSWFISGVQRLPNGNTLINAGATGIVFEVTPENETVWKFANPIKNPMSGPPGGGPLKPFEAIPSPARDALDLTVDQRKQLDAIDKGLNAKLEKVLTVAQWRILAEPNDIDVSKVPAGEYLSALQRTKLKLAQAQTEELQALQKEFNPKIAKIMTDDQKHKIEDLKKKQATAGPGGRRRAGNTLFRATRYALDYPAFQGKMLTPGKTLVEIQQELDKQQPNAETSSAKPKTAAALVTASAAEPQEGKSALQTDPTGWIDLLAQKDLKSWKRVSIPPGSPLKSKNPWSIDPNTGYLVCDGVGIHEMLLYNEEFGDGIFHVEWRFKEIPDKKGYNSGVYARTSADGSIWHQAQVGNKNVGYLFGDTLVDGKIKRVQIDDKKPQRGKEAGEWNTYEVTCKGKQMTLWINGAVTATWNDCQVPKGHVGLEAEGWYIDFRNVKFKR